MTVKISIFLRAISFAMLIVPPAMVGCHAFSQSEQPGICTASLYASTEAGVQNRSVLFWKRNNIIDTIQVTVKGVVAKNGVFDNVHIQMTCSSPDSATMPIFHQAKARIGSRSRMLIAFIVLPSLDTIKSTGIFSYHFDFALSDFIYPGLVFEDDSINLFADFLLYRTSRSKKGNNNNVISITARHYGIHHSSGDTLDCGYMEKELMLK